MSSLPDDICLDIFLRLSVKSTIVCKCVCKSWCNLISDPGFVKSHLNLTTQRNNYNLMFDHYQTDDVYSISYDSLWSSSESAVRMDYPYKSLKRIKLLGSCNGLVCGWSSHLKLFFLWNPATKGFKRLPKSDTKDITLCGSHGFGYDHKNDDYKLVTIRPVNESSSVQVFSVKSNSWKTCQSIQCEFCSRQPSGVIFNGAVHWLGFIRSKKALVAMDISEEIFEELPLPMAPFVLNIGVLEGCLCVLTSVYFVKEGIDALEVWIMQEYRVPDSWTKHYTITLESLTGFYFQVQLIGFFKDGEILFERTSGDLTLYDPKYGTARELNIQLHGGAVTYFESLVSLDWELGT